MAQVAPDVTANVDRLLTYLFGRWQDVPLAAGEWGRWDRFERADYLIDWPVVESYMEVIQEYAAQGVLTPAQEEQYGHLLVVVARTRPVLQRLMHG